MKSAAIVLWMLCLVVAIGADVTGASQSVATLAFWLGFAFLWVGIALRLHGTTLARWGGAFLLTLVVGGLTYAFLYGMVLGGR